MLYRVEIGLWFPCVVKVATTPPWVSLILLLLLAASTKTDSIIVQTRQKTTSLRKKQECRNSFNVSNSNSIEILRRVYRETIQLDSTPCRTTRTPTTKEVHPMGVDGPLSQWPTLRQVVVGNELDLRTRTRGGTLSPPLRQWKLPI
jgi:hypothetical protein